MPDVQIWALPVFQRLKAFTALRFLFYSHAMSVTYNVHKDSRWVIALTNDVFYVDIKVCIVRTDKAPIKSSLACLMYGKKTYRQSFL